METTFKVLYDDMVDDVAYKVINAVNELLKNNNIGFTIEDDGKPHDGFNIFIVKLVKN